jgi:hypothetical protein
LQKVSSLLQDPPLLLGWKMEQTLELKDGQKISGFVLEVVRLVKPVGQVIKMLYFTNIRKDKKMNYAWETTIDDVELILQQSGSNANSMGVFNKLDKEDFERIKESALEGNDMDEQTFYAYNTLTNILEEKGII